MRVVERKLEELRPYEQNAKKHDEKQIENVANSIRRFGWRQPIVIDGDDVIVIGHCRALAAKRLGMETVPVVVADDLTAEEIRELRIADNKTNESPWDFDMLDMDIDGLKFEGFDFDGLPKHTTSEGKAINDDGFDASTAVKARAAAGDIFVLGRHKLMCGDSTDSSAIEKLLGGDVPDTYVVDPPYDREELYDVMPRNTGGRLFVFSDHKHWQKAICQATQCGWPARFEFVWDCIQTWYTPNRPLARHKSCYIFGDDPNWRFDAAIIHDGKQRKTERGTNTRGEWEWVPMDGAVHLRTVESFSNTALHDENGYGKPLQWIAAMLNGYGGRCVLDLFGGSGTVLIGCELTGRTCRAMEIDPHAVDCIIARYERLTGSEAVKAN